MRHKIDNIASFNCFPIVHNFHQQHNNNRNGRWTLQYREQKIAHKCSGKCAIKICQKEFHSNKYNVHPSTHLHDFFPLNNAHDIPNWMRKKKNWASKYFYWIYFLSTFFFLGLQIGSDINEIFEAFDWNLVDVVTEWSFICDVIKKCHLFCFRFA